MEKNFISHKIQDKALTFNTLNATKITLMTKKTYGRNGYGI